MPILDRNRFLRPKEDALRRCRPVLVRISPGYPSVKGRLHTCYSPVRRSPAEESKLSPPLPLDLHVLSLSLAFILSQDQTLRCWLSFFIFFLSLKRSKKSNLILSLCCLHGHPAYKTARRPADPDRIGCLRWFEDIDKSSCRLNLFSDRSSVFSNLYYFVYCKNFNVLCGSALELKAFAKLRHFFEPPKSLSLF